MKLLYLILAFILGGLLVYTLIDKKPHYIEKIKEIEVLKQQIDTVEKKYIVYKEKAAKIVQKYDTVYLSQNFDSLECNRLLDTCIVDIYRVDSALKLCDSSKRLNESLVFKQKNLIDLQSRDIKRLKFPIHGYLGAGMGISRDLKPQVNINISVGYRIF